MKANHVPAAQIMLILNLMICVLMSHSNPNVAKLSLLKEDVVNHTGTGVLRRQVLDLTLQKFFAFSNYSVLVESFVRFHKFHWAEQNVSQTTVSTASTQPPRGRTDQNSMSEGPKTSRGNKGASGLRECGTDNASRVQRRAKKATL